MSDSSDTEYVRWRAKPAELAYRRDETAAERAAPLWPATNLDSRTGEPIPAASYPTLVQTLSDSVSEITEGVIASVAAAVTQQLAIVCQSEIEAAEVQISVLQALLADAGSQADPLIFVHQFVWGEVGLAATLALLDDLFCRQSLQIVTAGDWAESTASHLDTTTFLDDTGIDPNLLGPVLTVAATAAVTTLVAQLGQATGIITRLTMRYRDRWAGFEAIGGGEFVALLVEPFRPIMAIGPAVEPDGALPVVTFGSTDVWEIEDGLRFEISIPEVRSVSIELPFRSIDHTFREDDGVLYLPANLPSTEYSRVVEETYDGILLLLANTDQSDVTDPSEKQSTFNHIVATYSVDDCPGIAWALAGRLREAHLTIDAATAATVGTIATLSFLVPIPSDVGSMSDLLAPRYEEMEDNPLLTAIRGKPLITPVNTMERPDTREAGSLWNITLTGPDRPGLLLAASALIAHHQGLVRRFCVATSPSGEARHCTATFTVDLPPDARLIHLRHSLLALFREPYILKVATAPSVLDYWFEEPKPSPDLPHAPIFAVTGVANPRMLELTCRALYEVGFNIVGASASVLGDHWTGVFAVIRTGREDSESILKNIGETLRVDHQVEYACFSEREASLAIAAPAGRYNLRFDARDAVGVLAAPLQTLYKLGCSIESMYTHVERRVDPPVGAIRMTLAAPFGVTRGDLHAAVDNLADQEGWLSYSLNEQSHL